MSVRLPLSSQKSNALLKKQFKQTQGGSITPGSDLKFLQDLSEELRFVIEQNNRASIGNIVFVLPPTGTTFYFLGAVVNNIELSGGTVGQFSLINDGVTREIVQLDPTTNYDFTLPIDRLVGDGTKVFVLTCDTASVSCLGSIFGWFENTVKIS